jgi:hypothetical protein
MYSNFLRNPKLFMSVFAFLLGCFILFLFLVRVVFPDVSFDTANYHFFLGKSGVENFPRMFKAAEFFPLGLHSFNPLELSLGWLSPQCLLWPPLLLFQR